MLYSTVFVATVWFWARSQANVIPRQAAGGSGPYPAAYKANKGHQKNYLTDAGLPGQTIFLPTTIPAGVKIPVIVWGVGGCSDSGSSLAQFHNEISSQGIMVVVNNGPTTRAQTNATSLIAAADWVDKVAGTGKYTSVDKTRIAVSGWSCGGLEAYTASTDPRFTTIGIFSSGQLEASQSVPVTSKITKPIFYFLGGNGDPAQTPGTRDYSNLPKTLPAWIGTDNKGHTHSASGGFNGAGFAAPSINQAAVHWANWLLRGNASAATFFTNNAEATAAGWTAISSQNLDKINATPI